MATYTLPQVLVYQEFSELPQNLAQNLNAFVFGPSYALYKYDPNDEYSREKTVLRDENGNPCSYVAGTAIDDIDVEVPEQTTVDTDKNHQRLFFEDALVTVKILSSYTYTVSTAPSVPSVIVEDSSANVTAAALGVYVGDYVHGTGTSYALVTNVEDIEAAGNDHSKVKLYLSDYVTVAGSSPTLTVCRKYDVVKAKLNASPVSSNGKCNVPDDAEDENNNAIAKADRVYAQYRCIREDNVDAIHSVGSLSEVADLLGAVDPENPLAYGVYKAKLNSGNRPVYFMNAVGSGGWDTVLKKAALTTDVYALVPLTNDTSILDKVKGHVAEMSGLDGSPNDKHSWRIAFFSPFVEPTVDATFLNVTLHESTETASAYVEGTGFIGKIAHGDTFTLNNNKYTVDSVRSNTVFTIVGDLVPEDLEETTITVTHKRTDAEQAELYAAKARSYRDRRIYCVFPPEAEADGTTVDGYYVAAAVAGLTSGVLPQQPITNVEINGFDNLPMCYDRFDQVSLNDMALNGMLIAMQDMPGDVVYVRHQVSTAMSLNNLNKSELSLVKNLDSISYFLYNQFKPYIGRYNITPELLAAIEQALKDGLYYLESNTGASLYGPQLIEEGTEIISIAQNPLLQDRVDAYVRLNLPKPFNVFELHLVV